jgi:hypothetical protein
MSQTRVGSPKNKRVAYTIVERTEGKSYWVRVGTAFENRDGRLNVYLDAIPVNGRLQIREYPPDDERDNTSGHGARGSSTHGSGTHGASGSTGSGGDRGNGRKPFTARGGA